MSYGSGTQIWNKLTGSFGTLSFCWNHWLILTLAGCSRSQLFQNIEKEYTMKLQLAIDLLSVPDALALTIRWRHMWMLSSWEPR